MLAEIGAGIQIPPNSARILHSWGLKESLSVKAVRPESLYWKRWQDGRIIGHTRYLPDFERWFGAPYRVVHRAHLHEILHQRAKELGVEIRLGKTVKHYSIDEGRLTLADETIHVDLVVAADGKLIHDHIKHLCSKSAHLTNGLYRDKVIGKTYAERVGECKFETPQHGGISSSNSDKCS